MERSTLLLCCFCLSSVFMTSIALDTISAAESIRDGQTIVSARGMFEFGFFTPGNSKYRYLGVWYKKISNGTVVWVANREVPLANSSGVLKFNDRGLLVLVNQENLTIWSSTASRFVQNPVAQLLESGNLVIRDESDPDTESFLWQSFDYPDNTFLPGMKIGRVAKGLDVRVSSWKSPDDPSKGSSGLELDSSGLQMVFIQNSVLTGRSGPWNGISFSGMPYLRPNQIYYYSLVFNQKEIYYTYELFDTSVSIRSVMYQNGTMHQYTWSDQTKKWNIYLVLPTDNCDTYALCGAYGNCDISNSPACWCLEGFVPKLKNDWDTGGWSEGCVRRTPLDCEKGDGFRKYSNVKLPDMNNSSMNASMTLEECRVMCLTNCSCTAYANSDIRGSGSGCYLWFGDLVDIRQYKKDGGQDLYVRIASSELAAGNQASSNHKKKAAITAISVSLTGMLLLVLGICLFIRKRKRKKQYAKATWGNSAEEKYSINNHEEDVELPLFDFSLIAKATNYFSFSNLIGEGGFGPVYKGMLKGQEVAVKRLSKHSRQGIDEFKNEVKCISKLQHRNLVKLLGYCIHLEEKMLIYEYMPNKSLDFYIFDEKRGKLLEWTMRFHIINGIARGLLYLHQDSRLRIIHRDLKLSNVLLDIEMNPKISDFGMARSFGGNETAANTNRVVGTFGYMSPEYAIDGLFSIKSDVFSFGVLVLEVISGKRNRGFSHPDHQLNLLGHAWKLFKEERFRELINVVIVESCNLSELLRSVHVALLCVQHCPEDRPSMSSVVLMLSGEGALPEPKEPGFFTERKLIETEHDSCSVNEVTITMIEVR